MRSTASSLPETLADRIYGENYMCINCDASSFIFILYFMCVCIGRREDPVLVTHRASSSKLFASCVLSCDRCRDCYFVRKIAHAYRLIVFSILR